VSTQQHTKYGPNFGPSLFWVTYRCRTPPQITSTVHRNIQFPQQMTKVRYCNQSLLSTALSCIHVIFCCCGLQKQWIQTEHNAIW